MASIKMLFEWFFLPSLRPQDLYKDLHQSFEIFKEADDILSFFDIMFKI
jgi:hypothetical protein